MNWIRQNKSEILLSVLCVIGSYLLVVVFSSCTSKTINSESKIAHYTTKRPKELRGGKTKKMQKVKKIKENQVVAVIPLQKQLDSLHAIMEEDEYETFIDNNIFYYEQAKEYCEAIHSSIIEVSSGENLVFVTQNGKQFSFVTKDLFWEIIVFNGKTKPEQIDIVNVQDEMLRVYNKIK
jgi:hypothetical protein